MLAAVAPHTHGNRIRPRRVAGGGGHWLFETASLSDFPQQARTRRVVEVERGGALETWMLDRVFPA
jgi:hypothetical protein